MASPNRQRCKSNIDQRSTLTTANRSASLSSDNEDFIKRKSPSTVAMFNDSRSPPKLITNNNRTIYTAGRPPWYNAAGQFEQAFVIGLCGGSASGKTSLAKKIVEFLNVPWVTMLSMDAFYKALSEELHELAMQNEYNFDCPDAIDYDVAVSTLRKLKEGKQVEIPVYDFTTHNRLKETKTVYGANVIIFEGIVSFCNQDLLDLMDMKIFVDADSDVRLARRLRRDIYERGRDLEGILKQYHKTVKPSYEQYIAPSRKFADIVVPRGSENDVAIDLIVRHVNKQLAKRGYNFRAELKYAHRGQPLPSSLHIMEKSPQLIGIHTKIRSKETNRDDFIFYSKRLMRLLFEYTLSLLPYDNITVQTPQGTQYHGKRFNGTICGVSILRAGETMEAALCSICKDVRVGKILIQTNEETDEPELHYLQLPKHINEDYVILMDATLATGAAALMAIRVLLDHDVQEEKICFVSMIAAESGTHTIAYAFPKVKIVTTAVDPELNDFFHILPGIGNFGDRYFGT